MYKVRKIVNQVVNEALKEAIGLAMRKSAYDEIQEILDKFVGDILDGDTFQRYCSSIDWEIATESDTVL